MSVRAGALECWGGEPALTPRWECNGGENQRWTRGRGGQVQLAAHPGWCLGQEPLPGGTYSGSLVLQECSDGAAHMLDEIDGKLCEYAKSNVNDPGEWRFDVLCARQLTLADNCIAARDNRGYGGRMVFRSGGGDKFNYV